MKTKQKGILAALGGLAVGAGVLAYAKKSKAAPKPEMAPAPVSKAAPVQAAPIQATAKPSPANPILPYKQPDFNIPVAGFALVATQTDPLRLHSEPDITSPTIGLMAKGTVAVVLDDMAPTAGFTHLNYSGKVGWASTQYLKIAEGAQESSSSAV